MFLCRSLDIGHSGYDYYTLVSKRVQNPQKYPCIAIENEQIFAEPSYGMDEESSEDLDEEDSND